MKKRFRARFQFSIGTEAPDDVAPQASPRAVHGPELDAAARVSATLDRGLRILLIVAGAAVFVLAVMLLATMDAGSRAQGGRTYVTIAALLILAALYRQHRRLDWRHRWPLWMEAPQEPAHRRYVTRSALPLLLAAIALVALAVYLP